MERLGIQPHDTRAFTLGVENCCGILPTTRLTITYGPWRLLYIKLMCVQAEPAPKSRTKNQGEQYQNIFFLEP